MSDTSEGPRGPLHGVRVLEFSLIFSAPFAGLQLSDLGADVVKVEPPGGEPFRNLFAAVPANAKIFQSVNRGKRSLELDLRKPEAREVVYRLLPEFDVVVINYRPGVAERLGIDYETLKAMRPDLIYAEISGFDPGGPYEQKPAADMIAQAYSGSIALNGKITDDGAPIWPPVVIADFPAGLSAAIALISALYHRERTGEGQRVSVSLLRSVLGMLCYYVNVEPVHDAYGRDPMLAELGRARAAGADYRGLIETREGSFRSGAPLTTYWRGYSASDGGLVMGAVTKENRDAIRGVLGIEGDPTDDPDYNQFAEESADIVEALQVRVAEIVGRRTVAEWMERFDAVGAPVAPVLFPEDVPDHEEGARHFVELEHEITGPQRFVGPMFDLERTPTSVGGAAPLPGDASDDVLASLGGYSAEQIAALREAGIVG